MFVKRYIHIKYPKLNCFSPKWQQLKCSSALGCWAVLCLFTLSFLTLWKTMDCSPPGSSVHGDSPGRNTGVGFHALRQGIFPTQGLNLDLPHCRWILYCLSHQKSPGILEWVAYPFSRGTSRPRKKTGVSCIAGRFFTIWAITEAGSVNLCSPLELCFSQKYISQRTTCISWYITIYLHIKCPKLHCFSPRWQQPKSLSTLG